MSLVDQILGPGDQERTSGESKPDHQKGRKGDLIVYRNTANGRTTFRMVMEVLNGASSAKVVRYDVEGYGARGCRKEIICTKNALLANPLALTPPAGGNGKDFEPAAHDNGILSGLLGQCGCATAGVKSYKILVTVQVMPPNAAPINDLKFPICFECDPAAD